MNYLLAHKAGLEQKCIPGIPTLTGDIVLALVKIKSRINTAANRQTSCRENISCCGYLESVLSSDPLSTSRDVSSTISLTNLGTWPTRPSSAFNFSRLTTSKLMLFS